MTTLTLQERIDFRANIKRFADVLEKIELIMAGKYTFEPKMALFVSMLAQSDDLETQRRTFEAAHQHLVDTYDARLLADARLSLSCYTEYMTPDEPPAHHHNFMCEQLEALERKDFLRLIINMPPGHAKSKFCSRYFPAWYLGKHRSHKFIQAGHSGDFVKKEFGQVVRDIIASERHRNLFPDMHISSSSSAADYWQLAAPDTGRYLTKGVGQGIAGFRANIGVIDDPYALRADAESPANRKHVYDWFQADFTTRLLPRSPLLLVATRWHPLDICGMMEQHTKDGIGIPWKIINLPAIAEVDPIEKYDILGRSDGEPLWGEFYDLQHLQTLRASLPSRDWNSLYMGKPVDEKGGIIQADWFQRYETLPKNETNTSGLVVKQNVRRITISVDTASKISDRTDYTVITVWVEDMHNRHFLAYVKRIRAEFNEMVELIESTCRDWHASAILIEDKGSGTQYIQTRTHLAPAPVIPISVGLDSKAFRLDGVSPMFQGGEVFLPQNAVWLPDFERELLQFPGGAHDDQVDSASQYLSWARTGRRLGTKHMSGMGAPNIQGPDDHDKAVQLRNLRGSRIKRFGAGIQAGDLTPRPSAKIG